MSKYFIKRLVMDPCGPYIDERAFSIYDDWKYFYGDIVEENLPDILEPMVNPMIITEFFGDDHVINMVTRRSHTGILLFINNYLIMSFINRYNMVESSTFGLEFVSMRITQYNVSS